MAVEVKTVGDEGRSHNGTTILRETGVRVGAQSTSRSTCALFVVIGKASILYSSAMSVVAYLHSNIRMPIIDLFQR